MKVPTRHLLICAGGPCLPHEPLWEIDDVLEIGRSAASEGRPRVEMADELMSRAHARLRHVEGDRIVLRDLGSTNGTFLDGERLEGETVLHDGAVVFAGSHVFVYRIVRREDLLAMRAGLARPFAPVPTFSPRMARLVAHLRQLAASNVEILLLGETGVGKEVIAEAIHRESARPGPFLAINCAALPETLIESELFGYARGAHSTAMSSKAGLIERAAGGTLYLDEIGEMSSKAQAKLLRFLQNGQFLSLGATHSRQLEVRIVAATHATVGGDDDGLRLDLAARLGPDPMAIPPLRERVEDVGLLVQHFLAGQPCPFDLEAYQALFLNRWSGNVRELEKTVRTASLLSSGPGTIGVDDLRHAPGTARPVSQPVPIQGAPARPSAPELTALLERHRGNVGGVAREIGRQRTLVWRWLRHAGLDPARYRPSSAIDR